MNAHLVMEGRLSTFAGLTALVKDRIYTDVMPEGVSYPAITYQQMGSKNAVGATRNPGLNRVNFQVSVFARSRAESRKVFDQVKLALDRMRKITINGVAVDDCFIENDLDLYDFTTRAFYVVGDVRLHCRG